VWNKPTQKQLEKIPGLYSTEDVPLKDKLIYEHFFIFSSDWYMAEYDPNDEIMFGFAILNNDYQNAEWGNIYYPELIELNVHGFEIERDGYWNPKKAGLVEKIVKGGGV